MTQNMPMNRLLQGDVGSGKTAVALAAMILCAQAGYQAAFMAPTESLAARTVEQIDGWLSQVGCKSVFDHRSAQTPHARRHPRPTARGELGAVVGTHALLTEDVDFAKLGLRSSTTAFVSCPAAGGAAQQSRGFAPHTLRDDRHPDSAHAGANGVRGSYVSDDR